MENNRRALHWHERIERWWSSSTRLSTVAVTVSGNGEWKLSNRRDSILLHGRARVRRIGGHGLRRRDWASQRVHAGGVDWLLQDCIRWVADVRLEELWRSDEEV